MAGLLPLTADEAYYWMWSKHLAFGYYDHPPAIAWIIRAGTALLGDTAFGVRASGLLLSGLASWFVWQAARALLKDEARALAATLLFNLTLMTMWRCWRRRPTCPRSSPAPRFSAALPGCSNRVAANGGFGPVWPPACRCSPNIPPCSWSPAHFSGWCFLLAHIGG